MKIIAKIQNAIVGFNELNGNNYFNVLLSDDNKYKVIAELVQSFDKAVVEALKCQNLIEFYPDIE
jgi:hypothetical protein